MDYESFLASKAVYDPPTGLTDIPELPGALFDFQRDIVTWALRRGRAAVFAQTGLGKSLMELSWAQAVYQATGKNVLVLAPLAVAPQMVREADKFGIPARVAAHGGEVVGGITVTNYQKLKHFNLDEFIGVVLDESSILKSFDGKTRTALIKDCAGIPFRLAATATPAPNDFMELGNHAEFLGVMSHTGMLSTFFVHDGGDTSKWRIKGHAQDDFWMWMCSWAVLIRKPSDLGYDDGKYNLPPLNQHEHMVAAEGGVAKTLTERRKAARESLEDRVAAAVGVTPMDRPFVWWCNLNAEAEMLGRLIPGAVEVRGSDKDHVKEERLKAFSEGRIRTLITKPKIAGFGMNWQHCSDTGFVGLSDSFEQVYQATRRFWRFGQEKPVNAHFIYAETEGDVLSNLKRKESEADEMAARMVRHMADITSGILREASRTFDDYNPTETIVLPEWIYDQY